MFDQFGHFGIILGQMRQRAVQIENHVGIVVLIDGQRFQLNPLTSVAPLLCLSSSGRIDQNQPHGIGGHSIKVAPRFPGLRRFHQPNVRFMH